MLVIHQYKGYNIVKTGIKEYPWNIYKDDGHGFGDHVGYGKTLKDCKSDIDNILTLNESYLTEMAIINPRYCKNHTLQVEIEQNNEGPIPHMHVYHDKTRNPRKCSYVRLDKAEYSPHRDLVPLPKNIKEQFIEVMNSINPNQVMLDVNGNYHAANGYQSAVQIWAETFENGCLDKFNLDESGLIIPINYDKL